MGIETTFSKEDYDWFEELTGTSGNRRNPVTIEVADFGPVLDHESLCNILVSNTSFCTQLRFLYKYVQYQEVDGRRRMTEPQYGKALESIMNSKAFISEESRTKLEERWMLTTHPKYRALTVSFNEVKNFVQDVDPVMYERLNEVRTT